MPPELFSDTDADLYVVLGSFDFEKKFFDGRRVR